MKKIIIILLLLPSLAFAQTERDTTYVAKGLKAESILLPPTDTLSHKKGIAVIDGKIYVGNGTKWNEVTSTSTGGGISELGTSPFGLSLVNDSTYQVDTAAIATIARLNNVVNDSTAEIRADFPVFTGVTLAQMNDSIAAAQQEIYPISPLYKDADSLKIKILSAIDTGVVTPTQKSIWDAKGTVTNVSGVAANGFTVSVSNQTTTPEVTLKLTDDVSDGILFGTGGTVVVATDPTVYNIARADNVGTEREWILACSDETTDLTTGTAKLTFRTPFKGTITAVRSSLSDASSSGLVTVNINVNGTTTLSTKLSIDASEKTSTTAATLPVISAPDFEDDDEITIDIDAAGTDAKGLKVIIYYKRTL